MTDTSKERNKRGKRGPHTARQTSGPRTTRPSASRRVPGKFRRVFQEKINGARSDRKQLARLLAELDDGDTVIMTRLDRWRARRVICC